MTGLAETEYHTDSFIPSFTHRVAPVRNLVGEIPTAFFSKMESVTKTSQADFEIYVEEFNATFEFRVADIIWRVTSPEVIV